MTTLPQVSESSRRIGARIAYARACVRLNQEAVSNRLGFSDRQTLSSIENGIRRVSADELERLAEILDRPAEWFLDPFTIAGEGQFSWRVSKSLTKDDLLLFEEKVGACISLLRFLLGASTNSNSLFSKTLKVDFSTTFEEVSLMGEEMARYLDLGQIPSTNLVEKIEDRLDIPVMYFDIRPESGDISGAICKMRNMRVILINRNEPPARRSLDVAHELFHALTWDALTPKHMEFLEERPGAENTNETSSSKQLRIERLADNFAAALLMPKEILESAIRKGRESDLQHLAEVASLLQVSYASLAYRLFSLGLIDKDVCNRLKKNTDIRRTSPEPTKFSINFIRLLHAGIDDGRVSARKAAKIIEMTLPQLCGIFNDHGLEAPFSY